MKVWVLQERDNGRIKVFSSPRSATEYATHEWSCIDFNWDDALIEAEIKEEDFKDGNWIECSCSGSLYNPVHVLTLCEVIE